MSMLKQKKKVYNDGRTKQAFGDATDITKMLAKAQRVGSISHLEKYEAVYGDFAKFDFQDAQLQIAKANTIFAELPSELRKEFGQSPQRFFAYANDPENVGKLEKLFPALAAPGRQFPNVAPTVDRPADDPPAAAPAAAVEPAIPVVGVPADKPGDGT